MSATLETILEAPELALWEEKISARLREERSRPEQFYREITPSMKAEFINGDFVLHSPATVRHNLACHLLARLLSVHVNARQVGQVFVEKLLVALTRNDYEPDLVFYGPEKAACLAPDQLRCPAPDLVVEVRSPGTENNDRGVKFRDYAAHGIREYWLVDPEAGISLQQLATWLVLRVAGVGELSLAVSFGVVVLLHTAIGAAVTSLGACADAAVFTVFYRRRRGELGDAPARPVVGRILASSSVPARWATGVAVAMVVGLFAAAGVSVAVAVSGLAHERPITVTAHRGDHHHAPENTLAAVREAIAVGADYAEIDVQLSKDGILVVTHDSDFSRMAGVAKKVWDLTYAEIRAIPLGAKAAPKFRHEPAPTFAEVLEVASNRIRLNIELKYYGSHQPRLAERVVQTLEERGMTSHVIIQCLEYEPLQTVRRLAPEIPIGYLMSVNAQHPGRLAVDFLGAEAGRVTGAFVQAAHRRGQRVHVWTVDQPADLERLIALGVDDLITNEPAEALRRVRAFQALSLPERTVRRIHAWLGD